MTAYVDESLRLDGDGRYLLAAVVVPDARADAVRATLRAAVPPGLRRYHWRKEGGGSRAAMAALVGALDVACVVVIAPLDPARQERARRRCLTRLLWELEARDESSLVFESRRGRDVLDAQIVSRSRPAGWTTRDVACRFALPEEECLLWLPDVVAGATRQWVAGDVACLAAVGARVTVVSVP